MYFYFFVSSVFFSFFFLCLFEARRRLRLLFFCEQGTCLLWLPVCSYLSAWLPVSFIHLHVCMCAVLSWSDCLALLRSVSVGLDSYLCLCIGVAIFLTTKKERSAKTLSGCALWLLLSVYRACLWCVLFSVSAALEHCLFACLALVSSCSLPACLV